MCHRLYRPGALHAGAEHPAAARLDLPGDVLEQVGIKRGAGAAHPDATTGLEIGQVHVGKPLGYQPGCRTAWGKKTTAG